MIVHLLDKPKPDSILSFGAAAVNIVAPLELILERRGGDARDRGAMSAGQLEEQLGMCDDEWQRLQSRAVELDTNTEFHVIENLDLELAAKHLTTVLEGVSHGGNTA